MIQLPIPHNFLPYLAYLPVFFIGLISTIVLTPLVGAIGRKYKVLDLPGSMRAITDPTRWRRIHTIPKLKLGGLAVIIPFFIIILVEVPNSRHLWGLLLGIIILLFCGIFDDLFNLSAKIQAIFHILSGILVVASGIEITTISNPFGNTISFNTLQISIHGIIRSIPASLITIIWVFFIINAVKWESGSDGLVEGNSAIAAIIIGLLSVRFQTGDTAIMGFAFAGCLLGLLYYNFYPSKIMSGSAGKSVYGFILAILAIYSGGKLATFLLTLSLPILDAIWVIGYRIYKHKPKNLFELFAINDKSHIHYKLLELGFSPKQVALLEYSFTLLTGTLAFLLTGLHKAFAIFAIIGILILVYLYISYLLSHRNRHL